MTLPSFIILGYVWKILGMGGFPPPPIREQLRKGPSWIELSCFFAAYSNMIVILDKQ